MLIDKLSEFLTSKKIILFLILITFAVYFNSFFVNFVWDDEEVIVNNLTIRSFGNIPYILNGGNFSTGGGPPSGYFFRPLLTFHFMIDYALFGLNAWGYHISQIAYHIGNVVLIFLILQKLLNPENSRLKGLLSGALVLFFAIHPINTEAVVYINTVHYPGFAFLCLLAIYLTITKLKKLSFKWISIISFLILFALLYNESGAVAIPVLIIYLFLYRYPQKIFYSSFIIVSGLIYGFARFSLSPQALSLLTLSPISEASLTQRLYTIPQELIIYLSLLFFPQRLSISQHFVVTQPNFYNFYLPFLIELLFFGLLIFWIVKKKSKPAGVGFLWFLGGLTITSNIIPLDMTVAERWFYFPFLGLLLTISSLLINLHKRIITAIIISLLLVSLIFSFRTIVRTFNWYSGLSLFTHDVSVYPNSYDLQMNTGVELFRSGNISEAKKHFERSISLQPKWDISYNNLGAVYEREGDLEKAKEYYKKTLELSDYYLAYENLAGILTFKEDPAEAKKFIDESLKKLPNNSRLWLLKSISEYKLGNKEAALEASKSAFSLNQNQQTYYIYSQLSEGKELKLE